MKPRNTIFGTLCALGLSSALWALPQDPSPVHGQVQIQNGANFIQILQQSPQAIINWSQFNIGLGETVRFLQPGQQAAVLNRVTGLDPSVIQGMLQANGRVFLLNPNGILFGPNSVVDVGSFTASTLKMSDEDFLNGSYKLTQDGSLPLAALTNQGTIKVAEGGFVVLVSPLLDNQGMIVAQSGHVNLAATTQATFSVDGRGLVQFAVPDGFDPKFQGGGQGGTVLLQPGQMSQLLSQVVRNPGPMEADSFGRVAVRGAEGILLNSGTVRTDSSSGGGGTIRLDSSQASVLPAGGLLSANSQSGNGGDVRLLSAGRTVALGNISAAANGTGDGGFVEVSGRDLWLLGQVNVASAQGTGGTILLDPTDITIMDTAPGTLDPDLPNPDPSTTTPGTVSVSAMQGQSAVHLVASNDVIYNGAGFTLPSTALTIDAGNDIRFTTSGDIRATTLTLNATRDVMVAGTGSFALASTSTTGALTVTAGRNVSLTTPAQLQLRSNGPTLVRATTGDLSIVTGQGSAFIPDAPRTELVAGRNLTVTGSDARQTVFNGDVIMSGQNITLQSLGSGGLNFRTGSVNATASQDLVVNGANGDATVRSVTGPLNLTAGAELRGAATGSLTLEAAQQVFTSAAAINLSSNGQLRYQSGNGVHIGATAGDVRMTAGGAVYLRGGSGVVNVTSPSDVVLASANFVSLESQTTAAARAGRDLTISSGQGSAFFPDAPRTDLVAGRNLTISGSDARQTIVNGDVIMSGQNITLQSLSSGGLNFRTGSVNATATQDLVVNASNGDATVRSVAGPLNLTADANLRAASTGSLTFQSDSQRAVLNASTIDLRSNGQLLLQTGAGAQVGATAGDVRMTSGGPVYLRGGSGMVNVTSPSDVVLASANFVSLESQTSAAARAGRDLTISSGQGSAFFPDAPRTDLVAGRNLTISGSDGRQTIVNGDVIMSGQNITLQSLSSGGLNFRTGSVNATAAEDLVVNASNGDATVRSVTGPLNLTAGTNLRAAATGALTFQSDNQQAMLTAPSIDLRSNGQLLIQTGSGARVEATAGDVRMTSGGPVYLRGGSGAVNVTSATDVVLASANFVSLESQTSGSARAGRDLTITSGQGSAFFPDAPRTDLVAGRNLTIAGSDARQTIVNGDLFMSGQNITLQSTSSGGLNFRSGSVNATAAEDFVVNASNGDGVVRSVTGPLNLTAGANLRGAATGSLTFQSDSRQAVLGASALDLRSNGELRFQTGSGAQVGATVGDVRMTAGGPVYLRGGSGTVNVTSAQDVVLQSANFVSTESATSNRVQAGRDLTIISGQGSAYFPDAPRTDLTAGRNATIAGSDLRQTTVNGALLISAQNVTVASTPSGGVNLNLGSLNVTASEDFRGVASNGAFSLRSNSGPLNITAGSNVGVNSTSAASLRSDTGGLTVTGGNVALSNVAISTGSNGTLNLASSGNLTVGALTTGSAANASLTGANITINSMQNVSGGNYTITTPGNLTEITPATNPPTLTALNVTAGRAFNLSAADLGFSIPNAGTLAGLVTGGNETNLPGGADPRAAAFHTFTTNPTAFEPGHIDFVTGDIYRDGQIIYGALRPPDAPVSPPSPPPTPALPPPPAPIPITPEQVIQQEAPVTPEERSQILSQSNLALGNLGGFSRVLSDSERQHLTVRHDSLHQTWSLDPFSPTLSLTVPGGPPPVYASELAQLHALLMMSGPADDPEDKNRQAYNVIVDQELREIWEIRYWRHLLESFIVWEDRE